MVDEKIKRWQDEINEHLANLHPHNIIEGVIKPAIEQVIDDFKDSLNLCDTKEQKDLTIYGRGG